MANIRIENRPLREAHLQTFYRLRRGIGIVGFLLPILVVVGGFFFALEQPVLPTLSHYYLSPMRDVFAGGLITIGIFLIAYGGYETPTGWRSDQFLTSSAGVLSLSVALFPFAQSSAYCPEGACSITQKFFSSNLTQWAHYIAAVGLFYILAQMCIHNFRRCDGCPMTPDKEHRNKIYLTCGRIIQISLLLLVLTAGIGMASTSFEEWRSHNFIILILETICIWAFAVAWLVKGRTDLTIYGKPIAKVMRLEPPSDLN